MAVPGPILALSTRAIPCENCTPLWSPTAQTTWITQVTAWAFDALDQVFQLDYKLFEGRGCGWYVVGVPTVLQMRNCCQKHMARPTQFHFRPFYWAYHHLKHVKANSGQQMQTGVTGRYCAFISEVMIFEVIHTRDFQDFLIIHNTGMTRTAGNNRKDT